MTETYDRTVLENMGIYELRNIARKVGVACPTMQKKEELINKVVAIITGVEKPNEKINKQGRPAKEISSLKEVLDIFVPVKKDKVEDFHNKIILSGNIDVLMQDATEVLPNEEDALPIEGFLHIYDEGYGSIYKNSLAENVYVPAPQINFYKMKEGDKIKGLYKAHGKDELLVLIKIKTINNFSSDCACEHENFVDMPSQFANRQLLLSKDGFEQIDFKLIDLLCPVGKGNKCLIECEEEFDKVEFIKDLIAQLTESNQMQTLCLAPDELCENADYINNFSKQLILLSKNFTYNNLTNECDFALCYENILRLAERGEDVAIIIADVEKMLNQFINYYLIKNECSEVQAKTFALNKIKQIILNSKQSKEFGSITIFVFANKLSESLTYLQEIFNNKINLLTQQTELNSHFDFINSFCTKANLLLTKTKYKELLNVKESLDKNTKVQLIKEMLK